jgi:hypothetical protein
MRYIPTRIKFSQIPTVFADNKDYDTFAEAFIND